ncbi:unnamed protein product [Protopolystoma xenopodis]|uniref:Uncharacterized protein n=1 Tax=Protopolystoma xenopodis TaxID=117903 RepID=A0A3S5ATH9_9PLAT|nr:unnamed protein product [Protopolystoma xenopodis]
MNLTIERLCSTDKSTPQQSLGDIPEALATNVALSDLGPRCCPQSRHRRSSSMKSKRPISFWRYQVGDGRRRWLQLLVRQRLFRAGKFRVSTERSLWQRDHKREFREHTIVLG